MDASVEELVHVCETQVGGGEFVDASVDIHAPIVTPTVARESRTLSRMGADIVTHL